MSGRGAITESESNTLTIHASCVLVGRNAVLVRGGSGSGKSSLVLDLLAEEGPRRPVRLIADDAVILRAFHGRLMAFSPVPTQGLLEVRGLGIVPLVSETRGVVGLVVDLVDKEEAERMPERRDAETEILGISLPRLGLPVGVAAGVRRVLLALDSIRSTGVLPGGIEDDAVSQASIQA